ncbi:MAG: hypothetical protein QF911_06500 [Candidatus Thalassarchaeaceae archaeon]|nr:hypothetical protein [Candidatus Thalassarchaeaceae archaeon]
MVGGFFIILGIFWFAYFIEMAIYALFGPYPETWTSEFVIGPMILGSCGLLFLAPIGIYFSSKSPIRINKSERVVEKRTIFYGKTLKTTTFHFDEIHRIERISGTDGSYGDDGYEPGSGPVTQIKAGKPPFWKYMRIPGRETAKLIAETVGVQYVELGK